MRRDGGVGGMFWLHKLGNILANLTVSLYGLALRLRVWTSAHTEQIINDWMVIWA